ncbi:MAG TPA: pitrilysin family protein, partial [Acidobacteriota bacterium]|nr:pitrilysin family protein [Acidobacteriota bacterium]
NNMRHFSALLLLVFAGILLANTQGHAASLPEVKFEKYRLPNGLEVILHEDHSLPIVSVNVWYHVGSKNEKPGRTGFAHLFEHMMFQGSKNRNKEYAFDEVGGVRNGSTSEDRTNYWENIPPNYLEKALWMEADRLGFLLPAMDQKKLDNQRDVVKNERRQRLENEPYNKVFDLFPPLLYPQGHPYSWTVIGSMADLSAASMEDVSEFFRMYYAPNNASLCVAGDFNPEQTKQWIEKYFGPIPPGPSIDRVETWIPKLDGVRRVNVEDNVNLARIYMAWHSPAEYKPGDAELDLLGNILSDGKSSRLYKSLVYEKQLAQDVSAFQDSNELGSTFNIIVTARDGVALEQLEKDIDAEVRAILDRGVTAAELKSAKDNYEADFVRALEPVGGFGGRADRLNNYNVMLGDPGKFQWDLNRYTNATAADIQQYTKKSLNFNERLILYVVPQGKLNAQKDSLDRTIEPKPGAEPTYAPPKIQRSKLSNGMDLLLVEDHGLPLVQANLVLKSGWGNDPADRPGAASVTAELLDEGTTTRNALQISEAVQSLGADLTTTSSFDGSRVNLNILKRNLDQGLVLMADVVLNPSFPATELERQRKIYLGRIAQESKQPSTSALITFMRTLYGKEHPYGQPFTGSGTEASIKTIQREDLVNYYRSNYFPNNSAVVIAGDITMDEAKAKFEKAFGSWKQGNVESKTIPEPPNAAKTHVYIVDKPEAPQSMVVLGQVFIKRDDPDYETLMLINNALGGKFTSRINMNLREEKGFSYGANSSFLALRSSGPFYASAPVQTQSTKESIVEMLKEVREIASTRPLTEQEIEDSKSNIMKRYPQNFQTLSGIASQLANIYLYNLPDDEWSRYISKIAAITPASAAEAAKEHLKQDGLLIVVVGDRKKIEPAIKELNLGDVDVLEAP